MRNKYSLILLLVGFVPNLSFAALTLSQTPLYLSESGTPLIMLTMERDHKLYYEAYNNASDINGDGILDIHYSPIIKYYGYFDSYKCYSYDVANSKFTPDSITMDKTCTGKWSGDYLNYLTMSRMDALRRVLYGGKRATDSTTATVLERSYIPQDAHSWGKEYTSETVDGYDISDYTPLAKPTAGTRHIFANTTLLCPSGNSDPGCNATNSEKPLLRVLNDTSFRVWEWLSIERPVAGVQCATGNNSRSNCAVAGGTSWKIVPSTYFSGLTQTTYNTTGYNNWPSDHSQYNSLVTTYATTALKFGSVTATNINGSGNPNSSAQDNYLTIFQGNLVIPAGESGSYKFGVDGDDAVEVIIDGTTVAGWYGGHGSCNTSDCLNNHSGTITLSEGSHTIIFRHQERTGGDNYYLYWSKTVPDSTITDYIVKLDTCVSGLLESECRGYPTNNPTIYKPTGILQQYGENDRMAFGLITGSYEKNVSGGVLRKNISSLTDEIDPSTGIYTSVNGIIKTIDALKVVDFGNNYYYYSNCGVPEVSGTLAQGRCRMWGNPTAEIMYESLRYFAGKSTPTTDYNIGSSGNDDSKLGLPLPAWKNPYDSSTGYPHCSRPSIFVISDINPNFDTDLLPGRHSYSKPSATASFTGDISGLNVSTLADSIWNHEVGADTMLFIGQSGETYDGAPTPKNVTSFSTMRGLSPEEPSQQGGYYAASIAHFGRTNDLNSASGLQKTDTFSVALASPLPRIIFPISDKTVTLVPYAKTVGGCIASASADSFQPTNTIVDFYVDTIKNTDATNQDASVNSGLPYAKFRINYEDSEYGSDHDMDAITEYELTAKSNGSVDIKLSSNYAAGGCIQHMGYVISGTTTDGIYLEVRDPDTSSGSDIDYYLDTPHNRGGTALPTTTTRNFTIGNDNSAAFVKHDPLWYAAKWGGFIDTNSNNELDDTEWDSRDGADGIPDTYFLVTNASKLKQQMENAFTEILARDSSASAVATNSTSLKNKSRVYQARFNSLDWSGQLLSYRINVEGELSSIAEWDAGVKVNLQNPITGRVIITKNDASGVPFTYDNLSTTQKAFVDRDINNVIDNCGLERVLYLRGDATHEATNGTFTCASTLSTNNFRPRATSKLGDIINSNPWYVGAPSAGYSNLDFDGYSAFRKSLLNRTPVIYTASNDGMLHGFDASLDFNDNPIGVPTSTSGKEVLAYVPTMIYPKLNKLASQNYNQNHEYFVDGSPMIGDALLSSTWYSVLIGGLNAGGKGYYALNVTDPSNFTESNAANILMWEFDENDDADLGFTYNIPPSYLTNSQAKQIVPLGNGKWAAILGNGYNSGSGKAVLYILYIENGMDGAWSDGDFVKIVADDTADNGLSTPVPFDSDGDNYADTVYAGDLKGNMWKFLIGENPSDPTVKSSDSSTWKVSLLFKAVNGSGVAQPITTPPEVTSHPFDGQIVLFGTGKYIENSDNTNTDVQSFYGIWDKHDDSNTTISSRSSDLLEQKVAKVESFSGGNFRIATEYPINWRVSGASTPADCTKPCTPTHLGWYIDLPISGERQTGKPQIIEKKINFSTFIPSSTLCSVGTGWVMNLDYLSGSLVKECIYDTNNDNKISCSGNDDDSDSFTSGYETGAGIGGLTFLLNNKGIDSGVISLINGSLNAIPMELQDKTNRRQSWYEIVQ